VKKEETKEADGSSAFDNILNSKEDAAKRKAAQIKKLEELKKRRA
jgi:hypothetical protein